MPKDRLDFDSFDGSGSNPQDLLRDIEEATKRVKQRSADDKLRDKKAAEAPKNKAIMTAIIAVGAIVLVVVAYMVIFRGPATPPPSSAPNDGFVPMTGKTQTNLNGTTTPARPGYTAPRSAPVAPRPSAPPPSEPTRSNGSTESYDDTQGGGM